VARYDGDVKNSVGDELARLRKYRGAKRRDLSIGEEVERVRKQASRRAGALGGLDERWGELVPRELAGVCRPRRLTAGGVLTVGADDAAAVYELDQWLRGGGLAVLRAACGATLRSVKVVV
jgi:Dna[CI] antecedent, DciA